MTNDEMQKQMSLAHTQGPSLSVLKIACTVGDLALVTSICQNNPPQNPQDLNEHLITATRNNHVSIVRYLLGQGAAITEAPLVAVNAVYGGSTELLEIFLEHGWGVNNALSWGQVVLPSAVVLGHSATGILQWLLDHGADPNLGQTIETPKTASSTPDTQSGTCLEIAASNLDIPTFDLLISHGAKLENARPLHAVADTSGDVEALPMMQHLLDLGVEVNAMGKFTGQYRLQTALHFCVLRDKLACAQFLVQHGADWHLKNYWGVSAIEKARLNGTKRLVELFEQS